jgi:hypothetical protein
MSGGISSINLIHFELFSFKYGRITLQFQKLSGGPQLYLGPPLRRSIPGGDRARNTTSTPAALPHKVAHCCSVGIIITAIHGYMLIILFS